ncbi:MAG: LysR family transcriptional regulator [Deltaproteobacteria bacterium]|nr:LysR family transcriptional regulator [Deltaproteobacteria bacterium]
MEIIQLLSFYQIVKTGSFTKASENVSRTQSAISHQIKNLEEELGVRLFERQGKSIKLTWEGEILFDIISRFLADLDNLKKIYEDIRCGKYGNLVVATGSAIMTYLLPEVVKKFTSHAARVRFKLITSNIASEIQSMVLNGIADLGIGVRLEPISPKMNFLFWKHVDKVLLAAKGHPLSRKRTVTLQDVAGYPLLLTREGTGVRRDVEEAFARRGLSYEIVMELDVSEDMKRYVEMGIGISILSSIPIGKEDRAKFLILNVSHLFGRMDYGVYYRKDRYVSTSMRQFIDFFAPELMQHMDADDVRTIPSAGIRSRMSPS